MNYCSRSLLVVLAYILILPQYCLGDNAQAVSDKVLKLYKLDCGYIEFPDLSSFGSKGEYDGVAGNMPVTCFLIRHKSGDLLWDSGLPDNIADLPEGKMILQGASISVPLKLSTQLNQLGLEPTDIEFYAPSHSHLDHVGNSNLFTASELIISRAERDYMFRDEAKKEPSFDLVATLEKSRTRMFTGKLDVFGDGLVVIHEMPGHTPGHSILQVNLEHSGNILLVGDLYHMERSRSDRIIPRFNLNEQLSLESMRRFEELATRLDARVIIQHSVTEQNSLPTLPEFLD
jgi:N-acyl homoserine lactone hydrolase